MQHRQVTLCSNHQTAATLPATRHRELRPCASREHSTSSCHSRHLCLSKDRTTPCWRKEHAGLFCCLPCQSQNTVMAQLSSCLTTLCLQHTVYSSKTLSCSKQENLNSHDPIHQSQWFYTSIALMSIVCLNPDTIICRLQGMAVLPSLVLGVCV